MLTFQDTINICKKWCAVNAVEFKSLIYRYSQEPKMKYVDSQGNEIIIELELVKEEVKGYAG